MTWSYSGNPASSTLDAVRFLIGDTVTSDQLLQNEEIAWLITQYTSASATAAEACEAIAARFARLADKEVGDLSIKLSQKSESYRKQADKLRSIATDSDVGSLPTGIALVSASAELTESEAAIFRIRMHDAPVNQSTIPVNQE